MPISALTKIGIVKEANYGVGGSPQYCLPVEPPTFTAVWDQVLDNALRGIPAVDFGAWPGPAHCEASLGGPVYPTEIGLLLLCMLGAEELGAEGTPRPHTFKLAGTQPSLAFMDENGVQDYLYRGMMVAELTFSFNAGEGVLSWSSSLVGADQLESDGTPSPDAAVETSWRGWQMTATLGSAGGQIMEGDITFAREIALVFGADGLQYPGTAYTGPLAVTGSLTLDFIAAADMDRYTKRAGQETLVLDFKYGTAEAERAMKFTMTAADFGESPVELDRSGTHVTLGYAWRGIYNATDVGPAQVELKNALQAVY